MATYAYGLHVHDGSSTAADAETTVYTSPAGKDSFILGFLVCNITASTITVDIKINDASSGTVYVAKSMIINANSTLQFMQESKIVIEGGDYISILSNTANCLNVTASVMEITPDS
tara:strand:- start:101 stop:448 length:348 start_codon:yes stop_codon:yes gene_type:complete